MTERIQHWSSLRPRLRRWVAGLLLLGGVVALALGAQSLWRDLSVPTDLQVERAEWIWAERANPWKGLAAFYLVRDFQLEQVPQNAELAIMADQEYVVAVNGVLVGAGRYLPGDGLDRYSIGDLLRPGINRIRIEVRSSRGVGGAIARIAAPGENGFWLGTDGRWRVLWHRDHRLRDLDADLGGQPARSFGSPPFSRWGPFTAGPVSAPLMQRLADPGHPLNPVARQTATVDREWRSLTSRQLERGQGGTRLRFDFGRVVEGYVLVELDRRSSDAGLIYFGYEPPDPLERSADAILVPVHRQRYWLTPEPRRFRYMALLGVPGVRDVQVYPLTGAALRTAALIEPGATIAGVIGLRAPRLRTPPEKKIWRGLEGVSSGAFGEEG